MLQWWAAREAAFSTASKMARQYLGAPASSVAVAVGGCSPVLVGATLLLAAWGGGRQAWASGAWLSRVK